jgi:uncharacterized protein
MTGIIDADTHIIESENVWNQFNEKLIHRRPVGVVHQDPKSGARRTRWVINGELVPRPDGKGGQALATPPVEAAEREAREWRTKSLEDVPGRLADADKMGVDVQVVYPTLFIAHITDDAELDVELSWAYNRWLADAHDRGGDRLRWVAVLPFTDIDASIEQLNWSREHGAVGFMARGMEGDRSLAEPWFFPVYEEASRLNMPMCIHTGPGSPTISSVIDNRIGGSFPGVRMLPLIAFQNLVTNRIPEKFPDLRIGFIETGASWVPYVLHYVERDWHRKKTLQDAHLGPELFRDYRIFVACESDEDIPYLAGYIGEDNLISGSDYGHHQGQLPTMQAVSLENRRLGGDPSADLAVVGELRGREDLTPNVVDKILKENPKRFYGI